MPVRTGYRALRLSCSCLTFKLGDRGKRKLRTKAHATIMFVPGVLAHKHHTISHACCLPLLTLHGAEVLAWTCLFSWGCKHVESGTRYRALRPTFACTRAWQAAGKPRASRGKQGCFSGKLGFWTFQTYVFLYKPVLRNLAQVPLLFLPKHALAEVF